MEELINFVLFNINAGDSSDALGITLCVVGIALAFIPKGAIAGVCVGVIGFLILVF